MIKAIVAAFIYAATVLSPIEQNPALTPGVVLTQSVTVICRPGYSKTVRHTSAKLKREVFAEYGIAPSGNFEIDHLISLELGGADVKENLWPESYLTHPWSARVKDKLENYLHREVCAGRMPLKDAQHAISTDWIAAYQKYLGQP